MTMSKQQIVMCCSSCVNTYFYALKWTALNTSRDHFSGLVNSFVWLCVMSFMFQNKKIFCHQEPKNLLLAI